jgi:hypothetical protein
MRNVRKLILAFLAALPITSISTAAYSKVNEMSGEEQNNNLEDRVRNAKRRLFSNGQEFTTIEEAKRRISQQTGITDEETLNRLVEEQIKILMDHGIIERNEIMLRSHSPSTW